MSSTLCDSFAPTSAPPCSLSVYSKSTKTVSLTNKDLSDSEMIYISDGIKQSMRNDGRSLLDYRPIEIETGVIPSAAGSSRVKSADSELVVGVKCEIINVQNSISPVSRGEVALSIDCSPSVDLRLEGRGGSDLSSHLSLLADKLLLSQVDTHQLCIEKSQFVWKVYIDVLILNAGGCVMDSISLGIRAALMSTILPSVTLAPRLEELQEPKMDFEVDDRPEVGKLFPFEEVPVCVTVGQICGRFVWDLSPEEDSCSSLCMVVAVDSRGRCTGMYKSGTSTLSLLCLPSLIQNSSIVGVTLHQQLALLLKS